MTIAIINYPGALSSAVAGWQEIFELAAEYTEGPDARAVFSCEVLNPEQRLPATPYQAILLPPSRKPDYYLGPDAELLTWLTEQYQAKALLCSACAGAFILGKTGLFGGSKMTTHWALAEQLQATFPEIQIQSQQLLIQQSGLLTAGGMMSWLDLGLELVAQLGSPALMRQLGKALVVDTGSREQRYYQQFSPSYQHGDQQVLQCQHYIDQHYRQALSIRDLAEQVYMTERNLLRRFQAALQLSPSQYLLRRRVQQACERLENTGFSFEQIASEVGYADSSACRKAFTAIMGLSPAAFRKRFVRS